MPASSSVAGADDQRVLLLAPTGRDAHMISKVLGEENVPTEACEDIEEFCRKLTEGAGAAFITEEALTPKALTRLVEALTGQPAWSDFPLLLLTSGGETAPVNLRVLKTLGETGNLTLIERPTRIITLVSALRAALRARRRQYEVRDHLLAQKLAEEERALLLEEAETANRTKDEFLATMSHELRTPMTAILGWAQLMRSNTLKESDFAHALEIVERNARAQTKLIDDLLDISRIITGKLRLDVRVVDLAGVVEAVIDSLRPTAEARSIRLQTMLDPQAGPVSGDTDRLQQVVWNLVSNAIKFTPKGGRVQVMLARVNSHVEVTVSDSGKGISAEFLPHVFDRFRQADGTTTRRQGGLGLGLSIVRQLVELHGGMVSVESAGEGQGATFTVQLPLMVTRRSDAGDAARRHPTAGGGDTSFDCPPSLTGLRVLIVDDEPDTRALLRKVLEGCGSEVTTAGSSAEALAAFVESKPDVLISDIGMPEEDGYELIGKLRTLEAGAGRIPAIALTAYARVEDRVRALNAGFQVHVPKPIEPAELVAVVASLTGRTGKP
ncbi:MAG TPA: ATP-binding protein [Pyrinomonadaceae bacterium]|jgi:signal transduction histidine kinase|nr:ATP-binding protein [Pyrinomonadaceae bacterium]